MGEEASGLRVIVAGAQIVQARAGLERRSRIPIRIGCRCAAAACNHIAEGIVGVGRHDRTVRVRKSTHAAQPVEMRVPGCSAAVFADEFAARIIVAGLQRAPDVVLLDDFGKTRRGVLQIERLHPADLLAEAVALGIVGEVRRTARNEVSLEVVSVDRCTVDRR